MLKVFDIFASKGMHVESFEHRAMTEFYQNPTQYVLLDQMKHVKRS